MMPLHLVLYPQARGWIAAELSGLPAWANRHRRALPQTAGCPCSAEEPRARRDITPPSHDPGQCRCHALVMRSSTKALVMAARRETRISPSHGASRHRTATVPATCRRHPGTTGSASRQACTRKIQSEHAIRRQLPPPVCRSGAPAPAVARHCRRSRRIRLVLL